MIIKVDKEAAMLINKLCDIALRAGGLQNLPTINSFMEAVELLAEPPPAPPVNPDNKDPIQHIIKV
jgi:hypothetical protein